MKLTKGEAKKQAILETAQQLFYEKGYEQTSVQDILDVLETSKGSFYHHFESKMEVLVTLCEERIILALDQYKEQEKQTFEAIERLQTLLYWMNPVRQGEEQFLTVFFPLIASPEGKTIACQYGDMIQRVFGETLLQVLHQGQQENSLYLYYTRQIPAMLIALNNNLWKKAGAALSEGALEKAPFDPAPFVDMLRAYRFALERLTDAPFGGLNFISVKEWMIVLEKVQKAIG